MIFLFTDLTVEISLPASAAAKCGKAAPAQENCLISAQKITMGKPSYSQKPYRAPQKENIFCRVYANPK
ncbi:hypothetical protein ABC383_13975 [Noviherbaspirillum sp. 1P10PC]|uniref:hypothetical protein n=1 Tax=Noviherbaspirillum sp. 1P10PC TaxID=3132292 RepID=UPI0039A2CC32